MGGRAGARRGLLTQAAWLPELTVLGSCRGEPKPRRRLPYSGGTISPRVLVTVPLTPHTCWKAGLLVPSTQALASGSTSYQLGDLRQNATCAQMQLIFWLRHRVSRGYKRCYHWNYIPSFFLSHLPYRCIFQITTM